MLVLSRKNRETVVIDGRITVKVLQIKGNTIRLGIEAPRDMSIRRGELLEGDTVEFDVEASDATDPLVIELAEIIAGAPQSVRYTCAAS